MRYISHTVIHFMVTTTKTEGKNKDFKEISGGTFAIFKEIWSRTKTFSVKPKETEGEKCNF